MLVFAGLDDSQLVAYIFRANHLVAE